MPGSANERARAGKLWDAYEQSGLLLYSAEDHLRAILWLFEGGQLPTYSLYTLLRAAAEAVVKCAYLLDPDIDEKARLARALNVRWDNLDEQNKLTPDLKLFAARIAELEERATRNGITVFRKNADAPATDFGERRPSEVALFSRYLKSDSDQAKSRQPVGEMVYRFLSGHVHSMVWVKISNAQVMETTEPGILSVELDMQFDWLAAMLWMVLRLQVENIRGLLRLSGYPGLVWDEALRTATENAKARYVRLAVEQAAQESRKT